MIKGRENLEKKSFLICPIRKATEKEKNELEKYVDSFEKKGVGIHYPLWDTNQDDKIGYRICSDNRNAIEKSILGIKAYLNESSNGSMFDLGMTFYKNHELEIINPKFNSFKLPEPLRTFATNYAINLKPFNKKGYEKLLEKRKKIERMQDIGIYFDNINPNFLFEFGMAFMSKKPIYLKNKEAVIKTPHKSFENILLFLDSVYKKD